MLLAAMISLFASACGSVEEPRHEQAEQVAVQPEERPPEAPPPGPPPPQSAAPQPRPQGPVTAAELATARECASRLDDACVIGILAGRAQSELERALLIDAHFRRNPGSEETLREMRAFLELYPNDERSETYRTHISIFAP